MLHNPTSSHKLLMSLVVLMGLLIVALVLGPSMTFTPTAQAESPAPLSSFLASPGDEDDDEDEDEDDEDEEDEDEDDEDDEDEDEDDDEDGDWEEDEDSYAEYEELYAVFELVNRFTEIAKDDEATAVMAVMFADELLEPEEATELLTDALASTKSPVVKRAIRVRLIELIGEDDPAAAKEHLRALIVDK